MCFNLVPLPRIKAYFTLSDKMPRPNDSPDVATSKTLAYILRHGAEKESLHIRTDGYIKLDDVVGLSEWRALRWELISSCQDLKCEA